MGRPLLGQSPELLKAGQELLSVLALLSYVPYLSSDLSVRWSWLMGWLSKYYEVGVAAANHLNPAKFVAQWNAISVAIFDNIYALRRFRRSPKNYFARDILNSL
jgi:hypothetical protein